MRHDKLEMQLQLLLALSQNKSVTLDELCQRYGISRRSLYYYLDFYRDCGFIIEKQGAFYRIDRESPFFKQLIARISFTEEEAIAIMRILNKVEEDAIVKNIKRKLARFYDFDIQNDAQLSEQQAENVSALCQAVKLKRMAVLRGYSSAHSQTKRDRLVEPFLMMNHNQDVRCYELSSGIIRPSRWREWRKWKSSMMNGFMRRDTTRCLPISLCSAASSNILLNCVWAHWPAIYSVKNIRLPFLI